jgi:hypothetical protein
MLVMSQALSGKVTAAASSSNSGSDRLKKPFVAHFFAQRFKKMSEIAGPFSGILESHFTGLRQPKSV